jgi:phosphoglycolate phosphatase
MIVVGDTPADIACGRTLGAKAIGVATGHYSVDDLREHQPYAVFADLSDTAAVLKVILDA